MELPSIPNVRFTDSIDMVVPFTIITASLSPKAKEILIEVQLRIIVQAPPLSALVTKAETKGLVDHAKDSVSSSTLKGDPLADPLFLSNRYQTKPTHPPSPPHKGSSASNNLTFRKKSSELLR